MTGMRMVMRQLMTGKMLKRTSPAESSGAFGDAKLFWRADSSSDDGRDFVSTASLSVTILNCNNVST